MGRIVERLAASLVAFRDRQENLTAERGPLVLPARGQKNSAAQERLQTIDAQLRELKDDIATEESALAEAREKLGAARNEVIRAQWEERRNEIRDILKRRLANSIGKRIQKAAQDLAAALDAAKDEDRQVCEAVASFDPGLSARAKAGLNGLFRSRSQGVAAELMNQLEIDRRAFYGASPRKGEIAEDDREYFSGILKALDRLELGF